MCVCVCVSEKNPESRDGGREERHTLTILGSVAVISAIPWLDLGGVLYTGKMTADAIAYARTNNENKLIKTHGRCYLVS